MKKLLIISIFAIVTACSHSPSGDKKAELENLKKEEAELKSKILKLEEELADSSGENKMKYVSATEMEPKIFNHFIEVQAKVDGDEDVNVGAEMPGTVMSVKVQAGDQVKKGEIMATIDDRTVRQNMQSMKSQLDLATLMYNKQKNLWDQKIGSEIQFEQAKTQKESMEQQYSGLQDMWDKTRIKSPINGTVDQVNLKVGQAAAPGVGLIRVVNLTNLKVKGEVAESYITKVKKGNDVLIFFPDMNLEVKSKLIYSGQVVNSLNRTFNVEVELNPKEGNFHPNQVAVLKIVDYSSPKAFVVPVDAVQKSSEGEFVYVIANGKGKTVARRKTVTSGMIYNGQAEIKSGLSVGDKVITTGFQNVIEGDVVKL